jgi:mRNA-degrading endonuclease YafQ of YafQ-DinJ toxin-antitoxin module
MHIVKAKSFEKQYRKLPQRTQEQFAARLRLYFVDKNHPLLNVHSLKGAYAGLWSFNITADIRVIFDDSINGVVILTAVGSHSELYG